MVKNYLPISTRLRLLRERMEEEKPKDKKEILRIAKQFFTLEEGKKKDFKTFRHFNHQWYGIITLKRNDYLGTIISMWKDKPFIIRGYPKIKYADQVAYLNRDYIVESKYGGTNLGCFILPNGMFMCKTRRVERGDREGYQGRVWLKLLKDCPDGIPEAVERCCREENVVIFGELYGKRNPDIFVTYDIDIYFKVFDIVDLETFRFLDRKEIENFSSKYGFKTVEVEWQGKLTLETIQWLEQSLEGRSDVDGFVAKTYMRMGYMLNDTFHTEFDRFFCKIKSEEIKAQCIRIAKATIPTPLIREAIKKASENLPVGASHKELLAMTIEELKEEWDEDFIKKSRDKIKRIIYDVMTYPEVERDIWRFLEEMDMRGVDLTDKKYVMRAIANMFVGVKPNLMYKIYMRYLNERKSS